MRKTLIRCRRILLIAPVLALLLIGTVSAASSGYKITKSKAGDLDPGDSVTLKLLDAAGDEVTTGVEWESANKDIVSVNLQTGDLIALGAGTTKVTAYLDDDKPAASIEITVRGIAAKKDPVVIYEYDTPTSLVDLVQRYGDISSRALTFISRSPLTAAIVNTNQVQGLQVGTAVIEVTATGYPTVPPITFTVQVEPDQSTRLEAGTISANGTLPFSGLGFPSTLGGSAVSYITGLSVPTDKGTLYYGYRSESEPGAGVGMVETYYRSPVPSGQRALSDITFVPKSSYAGSVTITYSAVTAGGRQYSCKIELTVQGGSSSNGGTQAGSISLNTNYNTAVCFDSTEFGAVCREKTGTQLDYVIFAQPPERQGTLYTNYSSSGSYGSVVDVHKQYSRRDLSDIWFVPAPGYRGTVTVYYTGYASNGKSYSGQVNIQIGQEESIATSGLLSYDVAPGGAVRFTVEKFDAYCREILDEDQSISGIRFESLPSESEGALYYDYQTSTRPGTPAVPGTVYYPGTRAPRIDRLAFVASESFTGTLRLPFTGWTTDGTSFSGILEINVRGSVASGDIYYYCAPGRTVTFSSSDFTSMSRTITNRTLSYIYFQDLPSSAEGYLYISNSRVSAGTHYSTSNIGRISFRASNNFSGLVNIAFVGVSTGGDTFTGVVTIGSGSGGGSTSTSTNTNMSTSDVMAQYSTRTAPVRFYAGDLEQGGSTLSSIRFTSLPSSGAGYLYYQYTSPTQYGQQVNTGTTYQASGSNLISNLAFVPRAGYSGTVAIPYTGTNSNKTTFSGEVIITVSPTYSSYYFSDMAGYSSSQMAAVDFLYDHNITHGLTSGQYGPESSIRRGDFALMLYQAFEFFPTSSGSFADVSPDAYYATAVNTLYARGVVSGTGGGYYSPDSSLTRQDAICMVQRAMQAIGWNASDGYTSALSGYGDGANVSGYAQGAMALAVQRGYLPTSGGMLNPQQPLTRVDMAELLHRALTY